MLRVTEIFKSIQGEGAQIGWPAIFIRFAGCNLACDFCDTNHDLDYVITVEGLLGKIFHLCKKNKYLIVLTGGEPLMQPEEDLRDLCITLNSTGFTIQLETNGTVKNSIPDYCKYVACSPKQPFETLKIAKEVVTCWKIIYPSDFILTPYRREARIRTKSLRQPNRVSFYLQPKDMRHLNHTDTQSNLKATIKKVKEWGLPWKLSLQTQKYINVR